MDAPGRRPLPKVAFLLALAALLLGSNVAYRVSFSEKERSDFGVYRAASWKLLEGEDPALGRSPRRPKWPYLYPAPFAVGMLPLALLPILAGALVFYLLSLAAFWDAWRRLRAHFELRPWCAWPLLALSLPAISTLQRGQVNLILLWLLVLFADLLSRGREGRAGIALGIAIALKVMPALPLLGLLVLRGRLRATLAAGATLLGAFALPIPFLGLEGTLACHRTWLLRFPLRYLSEPLSRVLPGAPGAVAPLDSFDIHIGNNQSLSSVAVRLGEMVGLQVPATVLLLIPLAALILMVAFAFRTSSQGHPRDPWVDVGVFVTASVLVSPMAWHFHFVYLCLPLAALAALRDWTPLVRLGVALLLFGETLHFCVLGLRPYGLFGLGASVGLVLALWASRGHLDRAPAGAVTWAAETPATPGVRELAPSPEDANGSHRTE